MKGIDELNKIIDNCKKLINLYPNDAFLKISLSQAENQLKKKHQ